MMPRRFRRAVLSGVALLACTPVHAAGPVRPDDPAQLDRLQVTATRLPRDRHSTAAAITVVDAAEARRDRAGVALSEQLAGVPGVLARTRQNLAQDEQISIRGFGTRASFGLRGARLYVDGLPATMPDGQGQSAHFPLGALERIEVLRGPFSALYGNAAGGVISASTPTVDAGTRLRGAAALGDHGLRRLGATLEAGTGDGGAFLAAHAITLDGFREHSRARRHGLHGTWRSAVAGGELLLVGNLFRMPEALDPQGLTRAQAEANPRQASAGALRFGTRKSVEQAQFGAVFERAFGDDGLRLLAFGGRRAIEQVLSTPEGAQRSPLSAGGWIDLASPFAGLDARWMAVRGDVDLVAGLSAEAQWQARRGYENFVGTMPGVRGALRLRQDDRVRSVDPYLQATWRMSPAWSASAGLRHSRVDFESRDRYVTAANPDDSGRVRHSATLPVLGLTWRPRPGLSLFASAGEGFETPTANELAYRGDGGSGPNFALRPMRTRSLEAGLRADDATGRHLELALFHTGTRDELAVGGSSGGRTTFQNAGRARREGLEGAFRLPLAGTWRLDGTATWMRARYRDAFPSCTGAGCSAPVAVAPGTPIPGVPARQARLGLHAGGDTGWQARLEARHVGGVSVNQVGDERAPGYTLFDASVGYGWRPARGLARVFVGVDNLRDSAHIGSVIVNEANRRYYEPGPGRTWLLGLEWR